MDIYNLQLTLPKQKKIIEKVDTQLLTQN